MFIHINPISGFNSLLIRLRRANITSLSVVDVTATTRLIFTASFITCRQASH